MHRARGQSGGSHEMDRSVLCHTHPTYYNSQHALQMGIILWPSSTQWICPERLEGPLPHLAYKNLPCLQAKCRGCGGCGVEQSTKLKGSGGSERLPEGCPANPSWVSLSNKCCVEPQMFTGVIWKTKKGYVTCHRKTWGFGSPLSHRHRERGPYVSELLCGFNELIHLESTLGVAMGVSAVSPIYLSVLHFCLLLPLPLQPSLSPVATPQKPKKH